MAGKGVMFGWLKRRIRAEVGATRDLKWFRRQLRRTMRKYPAEFGGVAAGAHNGGPTTEATTSGGPGNNVFEVVRPKSFTINGEHLIFRFDGSSWSIERRVERPTVLRDLLSHTPGDIPGAIRLLEAAREVLEHA